MEKVIVVGIVVALLLVVGVTANLVTDNMPVSSDTGTPAEPTCGPGTCGGTCGGSCGIPSCGCGR